MRATRRLAGFLRPYKLWVILAPLLMTIEVGMDLLQPLLIQRIIDEGIGRSDFGLVWRTGFLMLIVAFIGMLGGVLCTLFAILAAQGFGADLRGELFGKVQRLSFGNLDRLETGGLITRLTNDVTQLIDVVGLLLRIMVRAPLLLVGSLIMATLTSPRLALLFLILIPLVAGIILFAFRRMFPLFGVVQRRLDALNGVLQENLAGVRVVRVFARGPFEIERFFGANTSLKNANLAAVRLGVVIMPALILVLNLGLTAAIWFGGIQIDRGQLQVGELIAFTNYLVQSLFALMMTSMLVVRLARAEASAERVAEVLASTPEIVPPANPVRELAGRGEVVFDDVSFRYVGKADQNGMTGDTEPVLRQISFTARPGQTVAILGATGSGKSTLVNLIPRFYDVSAGRILIDGVDIRQIDETTLRGAIAMALQESILFTGSIRDNIRFGRPDASDAEVRRAAEMAQAHEFIEALPEGYDAIVGQRGVNLSGGQKQRIAIARALILGSPILILDDSTSAVDVATERRIQEALSGMRQTCIIVAQRISAVVGADMILVLDGGRIVAQGTHDELMATSGVYRDIYESQMETGAVVYGAA